MKILFTLHHHLDGNAGAPGVTLDLGRAYAERGHTVEYISFDDLPKHLSQRAKGVVFPHYVAYRLRHAVGRGSPSTVVDASSGDAWVWAALLRKVRSGDNLLIWRSHGLEHMVHDMHLTEARNGRVELSWKYPLYHGSFRLWEVATSLRRSDLALFLNCAERDYAVQTLGISERHAQVVPNSISGVFLHRPLSPLPSDGSVKIAHVGSFIYRKGVTYGMPALERVLSRHPAAAVSFLGTGCQPEQVLEAFDPAVHPQIRVVPHYAHEELPELLDGHQVMFFPSLAEGFSRVLIEGMACGLAPIATRIGANLEVLTDGVNGLLVPPRNTEALALALGRLLVKPDLLERLRRAAHRQAQHYSLTAVAERTLELYRQGLADKTITG